MAVMGPKMRASELMLWATPKMLPCRAGSLRRLISELRLGVMNAKPLTMIASGQQKPASV